MKEKDNKKTETRERGKMILSVSLAVFGCILMLAGFIVPPTGIIDNSVLIGSGEVFTFSGSLLGVILKYDINLKKMEGELDERIERKLRKKDE